MRLSGFILLACVAGSAWAEEAGKLPDWKPLPPPPRLESSAQDSDLEPQVTITRKTDLVIEEYRAGGKLYMIKVTPKVGPPYYLVDKRGDGEFARQEGPAGASLRPPQWIIHRF